MSFKENLNRICKEQSTTLTAMCKELGLSTSKVSVINKGSIPKEKTMLDFAHYLHCSVMDFFSDDDEIEPANDDEHDILRVYRILSRRAKHEFMTMVYEYEQREEDA